MNDRGPSESGSELEPSEALMRRLGGKWIVQAIATAAQLRLPEALDEPRTLDDLAERLECTELEPLRRWLRVLVGEGVLLERIDERYELTAMGVHLRQDRLGPLAEFVGSASQWAPWTQLAHSVRTGQSAFERTHGQSLFEYLADHPDEARLYDLAVDAFTGEQARLFARADVLDGIGTLVDVGGGRGTLLTTVLSLRPDLRGVLFDRPHVVEAARDRFARAGLLDRCDFVGGDFFEAIPPGADAYVLKHVLHNWDDDRATELLRRCAEAAADRGRVMVIDALLLPGNRLDPARLIDLEMLVLTGSGRERSKPQMRTLLARAGLKLASTHRLTDGAWLLVGHPK
jgi:hypothetical protein